MPLALSVAADGLLTLKFNPFHDAQGRFAEAPWGAAREAELTKQYGDRINKVMKPMDAFLKKHPDGWGLLKDENMPIVNAIRETRASFMRDLGLKDSEIADFEDTIQSWALCDCNASSPICRMTAKGNSRALGAAVAWNRATMQARGVPETMTIYRGVTGSYANRIKSAVGAGGTASIASRAASSWSTDRSVADMFGKGFSGKEHGVTIMREIRRSDIVVSHHGFPERLLSGQYEIVVPGKTFDLAAQNVTAH